MSEPLILDVDVRVLDPRIGKKWPLPDYQSAGAAAIDLIAAIDETFYLAPMDRPVLIPTGLAIHIKESGYAALILPRSGAGHKKGLILGNTAGLIDSDYQGQWMISAWNRNPPDTPNLPIEPGERIAQAIFVPVVHARLNVVEAFSADTARAGGGFGSTGS